MGFRRSLHVNLLLPDNNFKSVDRAGRRDWVSGRAREVPSERHHGGGDAGGRGSGGQRPGQGRVSYSKT